MKNPFGGQYVANGEALCSRNAVTQLDPPAPRNTKQICGARDDIAFEWAYDSVGIENLPHHLDDVVTPFVVDQ